MLLPHSLQNNIEILLNEHKRKNIQKSAQGLTHTYREERENISTSLDSEEKILAYISMRMPATYAAVYKVLSEVLAMEEILSFRGLTAGSMSLKMDPAVKPRNDIESILDIGAGPGTATSAALELFPTLKTAHLVESNASMIAVGKKLFKNHESDALIHWHNKNYIQKWELQQEFDLSIFSYTLNEVSQASHIELIKKIWNQTRKYLVIIEPGSKQSFEFIHIIRNFCIENNISIAAPCPHAEQCPAYAEKDWCHFAARVQRSSTHRQLKGATKNYEDEKFSYLILAKEPVPHYPARIVRRPHIKPGHLEIKLCTEKGFLLRTLSKKDGEIYKQAKKSEWGDIFNENTL